MERNKQATILAFIVVFVVPLFLFLYWFKKPRPLVEVLPILSTYEVEESLDADGNIVFDTIYRSIPDFELVSHMGDTVDNSIMDRKVVIAGLFSTDCQGICLDVINSVTFLQSEYSGLDSLLLLSFSVDPERDSVVNMYEFARHHEVNNERWLLMTGGANEISELVRMGFLFNTTGLEQNKQLVLVDKQGRIRGSYDGTDSLSIEQLRLDTKRLFLTSDFPHTRLNEQNRPS